MEAPPLLPSTAVPPRPKRKGRGRTILVIISLCLLPVFIGWWQWHKKPAAVTVQTDKVTRRTITETVTANGKIYPVVQVHISPEVSGEIIALPVKEGQFVHKGDLLLKINPDVYVAGLNQAKANLESSLAAKETATANLEKAQTDFDRNEALFHRNLISESDFISFKVARDVARAQVKSAIDQVDVAQASVDNAQDLLNKTTIVAPMDGTISTLNSQLGERVLGTVQNVGTDIMTVSDLNNMEARVDVGEMDVVLLHAGQKAKLEVDSFKDRKFSGVVTSVGNSSEGLNASATFGGGGGSGASGQSATQFQVRIRITDREDFRPGMSVSADIESRSHTNALVVPFAAVTTRVVNSATNQLGATLGSTNTPGNTNILAASSTNGTIPATNSIASGKKPGGDSKPVEVVFRVEGDHVKTVPVKIGISDDSGWEILEGLKEGDEIVTGGYHAIMRDLDDGVKIVKGIVAPDANPVTP